MDQTTNTAAPLESVHARTLREAKERRKRALSMRGPEDEPKATFKEIGVALGVSTERARQMVNQAQAEQTG